MTVRRRMAWATLLIAVCVAVSSCAPKAEPTQVTGVDKSKIKIAYVVKTLSNPVWQDIADGAVAAGQELGVQVDVRDVPTEADFKEQLLLILTILNQDYSAIVAAPITNSNLIPAVVEANKRGIPWIATSELNDPDIMQAMGAKEVTYVGFAFYQEGLAIGEYIAKLLDGKGKVGIIEGQTGNTAARDRTQGYLDVLKNYPGIQVVSSQPADWDRQKALNVATNIIQANPDINALLCNNDTMALGAAVAVDQAGKKGQIIVTGDDAIKDALLAIKDGSMHATVNLGAWVSGYIAVHAAVKAAVEKPDSLPQYFLNPLVITKDNVDENLAVYPKATDEFLRLNKEHPYWPIKGF